MKGYIVHIKTSKYVNGQLIISKTIASNTVFTNIAQAIGYIVTVKENKINKHNYKLMYDNLFVERSRRLHSDIDLAIEYGNYNVVKKYTIKPIHIYE